MLGRLASVAFIFCFSVFPPLSAFAQLDIKTSADTTSDQWNQSVDDLKKSMSGVLQKNETLTSENEILRKKILAFQEELNKLQAQNQSLSNESGRVNDLLVKKSQDIAELEKKMSNLSATISQLDRDKTDLTAKISDREGQQGTSAAQLRELKDQVAQLEQKAKGLDSERAKLAKDFEAQKKELQRSLEESKIRQEKSEKELASLRQRSKMKEGQETAPHQDQDGLKGEIAQLKSEMDAVLKERQRLQDENLKLSTLKQEGPARLKQDVEDLKKLNKGLDKELADLRKNLGVDSQTSSKSRQQEKELQVKLRSLEKDNAALKQKVSEHMETIVKLNRDKAMAESLLEAQVKMRKAEKVSAKKEETNHQVLGYKYAASGQYKKAISEYELAAQTNPSKDVYFNLGFLYSKLGQDDNAISSYKKVLELDPNDRETNYHLYQIHKKLSDDKTAQMYYNKFQELTKNP